MCLRFEGNCLRFQYNVCSLRLQQCLLQRQCVFALKATAFASDTRCLRSESNCVRLGGKLHCEKHCRILCTCARKCLKTSRNWRNLTNSLHSACATVTPILMGGQMNPMVS